MNMRSGNLAPFQPVAVLFARRDSVYKSLGADVWDEDRDARLWPGGCPIVAHPPCRAWGRLRALAKPAPWEKDLARLAVAHVRRWGGVLEHPEASTLWEDQGLPRPGKGRDAAGGWTFAAPQSWWGHPAEKNTWFYICGIEPGALPPIPFVMGEASAVVTSSKRGHELARRHLSKADCERTPPDLAAWLIDLAAQIGRNRA